MKIKSIGVLLILALVCLFHVGIIGGGAKRDLAAVWRDKGQSALWRSARFAQNRRFANFVLFVLQKTPADAVILLPPQSEATRALSTTPFMQFFLLPRRVINCTDLLCFLQAEGDNQFKIIGSKTLLSNINASPERLVMFDQDWGILLPQNRQAATITVASKIQDVNSLIRFGCLPVIWIALMVLGGSQLLHLFALNISGWSLPALGYGMALGIFSIAAAVVSLCGVPLNAEVFWVISLIFVLVVVLIFLRFGNTLPISHSQIQSWLIGIQKPDIWESIIVGIGLLACAIAAGKGYYAADEIQTWGVKGYALSIEGSIDRVAAWGTNPWAFPLHVPIIIASQHAMFGDILLSSKWLFSGYFIGFMLVIYRLLENKTGQRHFAGLITLVLASTPILFRHASLAYANLTFNYYLVIAILLLNQDSEADIYRIIPGKALLSGLFFAFASWTRPEGLTMAWSGVILIYGLAFLRKWIRDKKHIFLTVTSLLIYSFFWQTVKRVVYREGVTNSGTISLAVQQIFSGKFNFNEIQYVIKSFFYTLIDFQTSGGLSILILIGLTIWVLKDYRVQKPSSSIVICAIFYALMICIAFYFISYNVKYDVSRWVSTSFDRAIMPSFILLWLSLSGTIGWKKGAVR
ncbi:MAG: hypothetical protein GYA34_10955 [Chloroflexi bacterium]|nr:hypothetical protein [Chloroflexota bacterium]